MDNELFDRLVDALIREADKTNSHAASTLDRVARALGVESRAEAFATGFLIAEKLARFGQRFRTPEQVSEDLGRDEDGRPIMSVNTIKSLARSELVDHSRLERNKIAFTREQIDAMIAYLAHPAVHKVKEDSIFGASERSNRTPRTPRRAVTRKLPSTE